MTTSKIKYDGDTTWKSGGSSFNDWVKYRKRNGIVFICGSCSGDQIVGDNWVTILILPEGYRPTVDVPFAIHHRGVNTGDGWGQARTDGVVRLRNPFTDMGYYEFSVSFPAL